MNFDKAINRINEIDWNKSEQPIPKGKHHFGYEYMRRMACFVKEQGMQPMNPLFLNVASVLGDATDKDYIGYCKGEVQEALRNSVAKYTVSFYLQLADYTDKNKDTEIYLPIYEPMIQLLELGYKYEYREAGLMIHNLYFYPLNSWYNKFIEAPPFEVYSKDSI